MKRLSVFLIISFILLLPVLAQTSDEEKKTTEKLETDKVEELKSVSRLPDVVKKARDAGTEEEEIQNVVKGVKDEELSADEGVNTIQTLEENTKAGKSNNGISEFVFQQKKKGLKGQDLGQAIRNELQKRHEIRKEVQKEKKEDKGEEEQKRQEIQKEKQKQKVESEDKESKSDVKTQKQGTEEDKGKKDKPESKGKEKGNEDKSESKDKGKGKK